MAIGAFRGSSGASVAPVPEGQMRAPFAARLASGSLLGAGPVAGGDDSYVFAMAEDALFNSEAGE